MTTTVRAWPLCSGMRGMAWCISRGGFHLGSKAVGVHRGGCAMVVVVIVCWPGLMK